VSGRRGRGGARGCGLAAPRSRAARLRRGSRAARAPSAPGRARPAASLPQGMREPLPGDSPPELPRTLTLRDLVLLNVVAVLSIRWLATSAAAGPSSLVLWVCAALLFFVPQGLAVADLAARFPDEGGIYAWTKRAFGEGHGFLCGWCYWINNVLYYPSLLLSGAVIATYAFAAGGTGRGDRWTYVLPATLVALWPATGVNMLGINTGR